MSSHAGKIVNWNAAKGFGFIAPDNGGRDVFVHASELASGTTSAQITPGAMVEFDTVQAEKGLKAVRVHLLGGAAPADPGECDVLAEGELREEMQSLVNAAAFQLKQGVVDLARRHGWLE